MFFVCLTCSQKRLGIQIHTLPGWSLLVLAWALTHSTLNSHSLMQGEVKFWSENTPYMEGMVKKPSCFLDNNVYLTCLVFRRFVTLCNRDEAVQLQVNLQSNEESTPLFWKPHVIPQPACFGMFQFKIMSCSFSDMFCHEEVQCSANPSWGSISSV